MRPGHLSLVDGAAPGTEAADGLSAAAAASLQAEELKLRARALAREQLASVQTLLTHLSHVSRAASAGELPLGVRELCRQIADDASFRSQTLGAVVERTLETR
jgi:hypothetical protein